MKTKSILWFTSLFALAATLAVGQTNPPAANPQEPAATTNLPPSQVAAPTNAAPASAAAPEKPAEPAITSDYGPNGLRMNFRGAPLNLVLDYLSEAAGFIINKTTDVHGTVEVWSKQPVTKEEAVELLSSVLKRNGYAVTRNGRILTILPLDTAKTSSELEVVSGSDPNEVEKSDEMETRIIPVRYASATQLVPNLELLLPTSATLSANESANTLILVATKSDIKRMLQIINALDTSIASVSSIKVRPLRYADAKETANLITQLFSPQSSNQNQNNRGNLFNFGGPGGPGGFGRFAAMAAQANGNSSSRGGAAGAKIVAVGDDRSNAVVISAPSDILATIEKMLDEIDQPTSDIAELRVFRLRNADPAELADQLTQLFPDETNSNNNNNNQNVPFFMRRFGGGQSTRSASGTDSDRMKKMGRVLAVPDPRTSSLIVTASKTLMPEIADMIAELDSDKGRKEVVSYYELQNADPQDVYQSLQDLFNRSTVRMQNNNNQNTMLGRNNPLTQRQTQNQQINSSGNSSSLGGRSSSTTSRFGQ